MEIMLHTLLPLHPLNVLWLISRGKYQISIFPLLFSGLSVGSVGRSCTMNLNSAKHLSVKAVSVTSSLAS